MIKELKREKRKVRKINRERFNSAREKAAENSINRHVQQQIDGLEHEYDIMKHMYMNKIRTSISWWWVSVTTIISIWLSRELYYISSCECT